MTLEEWAEWLAEALPEEYRERQRSPQPETAVRRQIRLAIYEERASLGLALWHPDDTWAENEDVAAPLATGVVSEREVKDKKSGKMHLRHARLKNGRPNPSETLTST